MDDFRGKPRLPKFAVPERYVLRLKPDLVSCRFSGAVAVDVDVIADTRFLVLNAADLSFDSASVSFTDPNSLKVLKPSKLGSFEEDEILVLEFAEKLPLGVGVLALQFEGILNDDMKGFYRSTYEYGGEIKNMAVTQFEPADARRCFPCWDEPNYKATFKMTLDVPSEQVALSNMPIIQEELNGNLKTVSYQESPKMSTYLVAIVVALLDYVEDYTSDGVKVRVYCRVGKGDQGKFALHVAVKSLELYKEYFGVPYALPKLDLAAIPDFAAGAMENYGLVTFREAAVLYDDQHSAASAQQEVATTVAHELAHQWFGDLVTMEWWTDLWLNEGFATWMSYLANDSIFPEWNIWTQFLEEPVSGLKLDGLEESHPIEVEVNFASEIDQIFDSITYEKGASIIQMLQSYLGAESFQRSLASYIKKHAYKNATTEDLWVALEEGSGQPVKKLMNTWTKQQGYPVVSVRVKDGKLEFEQSQFLYSGSVGDGQWIVPITLCCGSYNVQRSFLLDSESASFDINEFLGSSISNRRNSANFSWMKLNVDQSGFYRVKYDDDLIAKLRQAIENNYLSATDRFGILDDTFALCTARQQSLVSLLMLMVAYRDEVDYSVLSNLITISLALVRIAADSVPKLLNPIKKIFIGILQKSAERLGWQPKDGEGHLDAMLRGEVFSALAVFGHDPTLNEASRRFHAFLDDKNTPLLPPDIRKAVYKGVMQRVTTSNRSDYESLLKIYRKSDLSEEKTRILGCLASCPDTSIVLEALNFLLTSEVRNQDAIYGLAVSIEGREVAWTWLKENWDYISENWGSGTLIATFVSRIVTPFASAEKLKDIEDFFADRVIPEITRTLKQSIEQVRINVNWVQSVASEKDLPDTVKQLAHKLVKVQREPIQARSDVLKLTLCCCFFPVPPQLRISVSHFLKRFDANASWLRSVQNETGVADAVKELAYRKNY